MSGSDHITVLSDLSLEIAAGSWALFLGPSGAGKSTLISILAGLEVPDTGELWVAGENLAQMNEDERTKFRAQNVAFVFQNFRLVPTLTAFENVRLALEISGAKHAETSAHEWLDRVGLARRADHFPGQLSGGEQQRVALARAFATKPKVLFADEPTGNLDSHTGRAVLDLMGEMQRSVGTTIVMVSHDEEITRRVNVVHRLKDGQWVV
ncbi:MAG TPA: ABC transporter ATP-binding protein [Bdellovibrionota bacterium]|jgi:putative ABC transport system ATP-binding protein|nr:ABC transporter ATP-binding protein [Bdellovibrionota bacterium]